MYMYMYHRKSNLKRCNSIQEFLGSDIYCGSYSDFRSSNVNTNGPLTVYMYMYMYMYHRKSNLKRCNSVQEFFGSDIYCGNFRSSNVNTNGPLTVYIQYVHIHVHVSHLRQLIFLWSFLECCCVVLYFVLFVVSCVHHV